MISIPMLLNNRIIEFKWWNINRVNSNCWRVTHKYFTFLSSFSQAIFHALRFHFEGCLFHIITFIVYPCSLKVIIVILLIHFKILMPFISIILFSSLIFTLLAFLFGLINYLLSLFFIGAKKSYLQLLEGWNWLFIIPSSFLKKGELV